jgi:SAM-dependent methyltransferase
MSKKQNSHAQGSYPNYTLPGSTNASNWQDQLNAVALRYNREYRGDAPALPPEVEAMPIFQDWVSKTLQTKVASPFWELAKPKKQQRCLDIGCGISFLIYPWRDWDAFFYGLEISTVARDALNARGPQLNSKLFKGVQLGAAHQLDYEAQQFDLVVATGVSCYYSIDYWLVVLGEVSRILKPSGSFVFDFIDPETPLAENWAILETYLGAEVVLESIAHWKSAIENAGAKIQNIQAGELFQLVQVQFR